MKTYAFFPALLCILTILNGCSVTPVSEPPPSPAAQQALANIQNHYLAGQYGAVIRTVATSDDIAMAPTTLRIEAYKLQAFSYCVRNYPQLCKETFMRILAINPDFLLMPTEAGHPQWSPAFDAAQNTINKHE